MGVLHGEGHGARAFHSRLGLAEGTGLKHLAQASEQGERVRAIGCHSRAHLAIGMDNLLGSLGRSGRIGGNGLGGPSLRFVYRRVLVHGALLASCALPALYRETIGPRNVRY